MHDPEAEAAKVRCTRCGTTRQWHVQLAAQKCPVRGLFRGGEEVAASTAVCAAWAAAVRAMHCRGKPAGWADQRPADLPTAREQCELVCLSLRPFRSQVIVRTVEAEFCSC